MQLVFYPNLTVMARGSVSVTRGSIVVVRGSVIVTHGSFALIRDHVVMAL
jgi:hypothetical protein